MPRYGVWDWAHIDDISQVRAHSRLVLGRHRAHSGRANGSPPNEVVPQGLLPGGDPRMGLGNRLTGHAGV